MSKVCQLTGAKPSTGHNVSHSNRKTKRRYLPNLVTKRIIDPVTGKKIRVKMTVRALHTLAKNPSKFKVQLAAITKKQHAPKKPSMKKGSTKRPVAKKVVAKKEVATKA